MSIKNSFAAAVAAVVTAAVFTAASQPVEAAIFTWRTGATGTGNVQNFSNPTNWVGGVAAVSNTADTTLQFTSNTVSGSIQTNPGSFFGINQLLIDGTTTYRQGNGFNIGDGGSIVNTSSAPQWLTNVNANGTGFSVTSTSGTFILGPGNLNRTGTAAAVTFSGAGQKRIEQSNPGFSVVNAGGPLTLVGSGAFPNNINMSGGANVTLNAGSLSVGDPGTPTTLAFLGGGAFSGAAGATINLTPDGQGFPVGAASEVNYNGVSLNMNLDAFPDTLGYAGGDFVAAVFDAATYTGNLGSLSSVATSSPFAGLAWSQVGSVWQSSVYNTNQQLEFRPADGSIYVVPEPTQMVFVAGVAAALGAWRMRKLRRNARGSDATAC